MAKSKKKRLRLVLLVGACTAGFIAYKLSGGGPAEAMARKELEKRYGKEAADRILTTFRAEYAELRKDGRQASGVMRFHLTNARQGLALYRALTEELGSSGDAVDAAHEIMWQCFLRTPSILLGYLLGMYDDPFPVFTRGVDWVNTHIFPPAVWERTRVELENGIGFDFTGCFYNDYLREKGAPELIPAFCEMDVKQAECFPASIRFERTKMLSKGEDVCDFRFYRE